jgi:hypothetical protein
MNLWDSLQDHENRHVYDGTPPQGLSEAQRAGVFLNCLLLIRRVRPFGSGGNHCTWRIVNKNLVHNCIVQFSWEIMPLENQKRGPVSDSDGATGAHRLVGARPVEHGC